VNIAITTIPHNAQRYSTAGDWRFDARGNLLITVSKMGNPLFEFLVAYHELVEVMLCKQRGITEKQVDDFDMNWKEHDGLVEPGADPAAPYHAEHMFAMGAEYAMLYQLGVDRDAYEKALDSLE